MVIVGLVTSLGIFGLSKKSGGTSAELDWDVKEPVKTPVERQLGDKGTFRLARTSISAIAPNVEGELIYRVSGMVTIDSDRRVPTVVRCDIATTNGGESMIARTPNLRAAWPRPSDDLHRQEVPETAVVKFNAVGASVLGLPIRDVFRRYTDSDAPTLVDWDGYEEKVQNWVWTMEEGTGSGAATLGYAVVFKTAEQPTGEIECKAALAPGSGSGRASTATIKVPLKLETWPIVADDEPIDAETGADATNVE